MVKRKQGLKASNRKLQHDGKKIDLKAPSYKWLVCRRCEIYDVKVSIETVACICSICMTIACDHMPRVIDATKPKKSLKIVNTFEKNREKEEKEANLAAIFKKKKAAKDDSKPKPKKKSRKKKITKKKTRKKRVTKNKPKRRTK